jgi:hypothetical protein
MLHELLTANRNEVINRCRHRATARAPALVSDAAARFGVPCVLDQLIGVLQSQCVHAPQTGTDTTRRPRDEESDLTEIDRMAARHGSELSLLGFTVNDVVQDYGDLCQTITEVALERGATIQVGEFRTLNRCLDRGIASALTEYSTVRLAQSDTSGADRLHEALGILAHEVRNFVLSARLAARVIRRDCPVSTGKSLGVLERSLEGLQILVERSLADLRDATIPAPKPCAMRLAELVGDLTARASLEAELRGCSLQVSPVDEHLWLHADREQLFAAIWNLLQNACKFTAPGTTVTLHTQAFAGRVRIEVQDHCGGLPHGVAESLFQPFVQCGADRSGLGLGLTISQRIVAASGGQLTVRDEPGTGCVFAIDLPCLAESDSHWQAA